MEIRKTETPSRELLLLADEVEASVADYIGRGTCYAACDDGRIVGQYVLIHTRPFTAEVVNIAVVPDRQRQGIATALWPTPSTRPAGRGSACSKSARAIRDSGRSPSTNAADSSAAAST